MTKLPFRIKRLINIEYMKVKNLCFGIMLVFLCLSCSKGSTIRKGIESINDVYCEELEFEEMPITSLLGRPYQLNIIDSILLIADNMDGKALLMYDLTSGFCKHVLNIGQGPSDVLVPLSINTFSDSEVVSILQRQNGLCREYLLSDLLKDSIDNFKSINLISADRFVKTETGYLGSGFYKDGMFCSFDNKGNVVEYKNTALMCNIEDAADKYRLLQGSLAFNKKVNRIMFAPSFISNVELYSCNDNRINKIDSFSIGYPTRIEEKIMKGEKKIDIGREDIRNCISVCSSGNSFYVLYNGTTMEKQDEARYRYILQFDAGLGNLDRVYRVDPKIINICVSEDDNIIYAILLNKDLDYVIAYALLNNNI